MPAHLQNRVPHLRREATKVGSQDATLRNHIPPSIHPLVILAKPESPYFAFALAKALASEIGPGFSPWELLSSPSHPNIGEATA
jgi:hypothetical protein